MYPSSSAARSQKETNNRYSFSTYHSCVLIIFFAKFLRRSYTFILLSKPELDKNPRFLQLLYPMIHPSKKPMTYWLPVNLIWPMHFPPLRFTPLHGLPR